MFFSENKNQKNNKIRFQNPDFRRKLQQARGYKRSIKKIPATKMGIFLASLGLTGVIAKVATFLALLLLIYLIYAPNFLTVAKVEIRGADGTVKKSILKTIADYSGSKALWPQSNLLLLSKKNLAGYLSQKNLWVNQVIKIEKHFPSSLIVEIERRYDKFLLKSGSGIYVVANDGLVSKQLTLEDLTAASSTLSALVAVNLREEKTFYEKQRLADAGYFDSLNEILNRAQNDLQNPLAGVELENFENPNMAAKTAAGFIIKFDVNSDLAKIFSQLKLLLKDIGESRISGVKYIDMRIKNRGYVCYKDAACARETAVIIETATSTPSADRLKIKD